MHLFSKNEYGFKKSKRIRNYSVKKGKLKSKMILDLKPIHIYRIMYLTSLFIMKNAKKIISRDRN